jgi:hypothetical protein
MVKLKSIGIGISAENISELVIAVMSKNKYYPRSKT